MSFSLLTASSVISFSRCWKERNCFPCSHSMVYRMGPVSCYPRRLIIRACAMEVRKSSNSTWCLLMSMMKTNHDRWLLDSKKFYYKSNKTYFWMCSTHTYRWWLRHCIKSHQFIAWRFMLIYVPSFCAVHVCVWWKLPFSPLFFFIAASTAQKLQSVINQRYFSSGSLKN